MENSVGCIYLFLILLRSSWLTLLELSLIITKTLKTVLATYVLDRHLLMSLLARRRYVSRMG